jgi:hypothetical protein
MMERPPQATARRTPPPSAAQTTPIPASKLTLRPSPPAGTPNSSNIDWILLTLIAVGFVAMVVLPMFSGLVLHAWPGEVGARTAAFFLADFGGWGFVLFLWSCCVFSQSKGRSGAWGCFALLGLPSFILIATTGSIAWGLLGLLGVAGFLVPLALPADRVLVGSSLSTSKTKSLLALAGKTTWIWALALFVGVSWAYGNSFRGGMTLDNKYIIEEYFKAIPRIAPTVDMYSWTKMLPLFFQNDYWWPKGISGLYRPVAVLTFWMNYATNHAMGNADLDPFQFHVVNFFLHWFAAILAFVLMRQLTGRASVSFFTALIFATHPIATESVSNIIGRSDILAAIATFACLSLYIRSTRSGGMPSADAQVVNTQLQPWRILPWIVFFSVTELAIILFLIASPWFSTPTWLEYTGIALAFVVPLAGFAATLGAWRNRWTTFPWIGAMMAVLAVGLFAKESAIAVVGAIVVYDAIYRWTLEDLRSAIPSLLGFALLGALAAICGLEIGQFGALGLSEGLTPVLVIFLVGSLLAAGCFALAWTFWVLNKPLSFSEIGGPWIKYFVPYLATIPPILLWLSARRWVFANASPPETPFLDNPIRGLGFFAARMTASDVFVRLLGLLAWPGKLSCDYSFNQIPLFDGRLGVGETWIAFAGVLTLIGMAILIALCFQRHKLLCFVLVFYLIAYLPTSNFLIIIGSIMAERFLYLPLIAFAACLVLGLEAIGKRFTMFLDGGSSPTFLRSAMVPALLVLLAFVYGVRARFRNDDWLTDITLWTSAAKVSPMSFRSYQSKAFALYEQYIARGASGAYKDDPQLRDQDVDACYETAEKAKPIVDPLPAAENSSRLYLHLGMYYSAKAMTVGHFAPNGTLPPDDPAIDWFRRAESVLQQGVVIDRTFDGVNRSKEIARKIKDPVEIPDVGLPPIYSCLGNAYARLGEWPKSIQAFVYMRHLEPIDAESYVGVATGYSAEGRAEPEAVALLQALILDNKRTELWSALAGALAQINHSGSPALTSAPGGKVQLHTEVPEVRSVLCSAYQGLVRIFLLARRKPIADQFRSAAMSQWGFSSALFDDLVTDPSAESPAPPPAD